MKKIKKLLVILAVFLFVAGCITVNVTIVKGEELAEKELKYKPFECPTSHITNNHLCLNCHVRGNFKVRETPLDAVFEYPNRNTKIRSQIGETYGYFYLEEIDASEFRETLDYFYSYNFKKMVVDIQSPGGSLFCAWRIKGMIDEAISRGITVQTRLYGIAASAGFLIFCAGNERVVTPTAEGMWHEISVGEWLTVKTPSDKEDEALVLRHLQTTANEWMASKASKITKNDLDRKTRKKEFWINGKEMFEMGFATQMIGNNH